MKDKSHGNNRSQLLALTLILLWCTSGCHSAKEAQLQQLAVDTTADNIAFEGVLESLGPDPGLTSGRFTAYRLAKYRVLRVCRGTYDQSEIVVDHAIFTAQDFEGIELKDRVCMTVRKSGKILARYNAEGIRSASEEVKTFYIANEFKRIEGSAICCDDQP
ncbi:MAG TPA: hypothetical protein VIT88_11605 [Pyrinomonadaceae bacterium]